MKLMILLISVIFLVATAGLAIAQQQYVFPQKGQSAEQQKKDEYECHSGAVKQPGFSPRRSGAGAAAGPGSAEGIGPEEHEAAGLSPGTRRLSRGERIFREIGQGITQRELGKLVPEN